MGKNKPVNHVEKLENGIRESVSRYTDQTPEFRRLSELDYCKAIEEALDLYAFGIKSRIQELTGDHEDR